MKILAFYIPIHLVVGLLSYFSTNIMNETVCGDVCLLLFDEKLTGRPWKKFCAEIDYSLEQHMG